MKVIDCMRTKLILVKKECDFRALMCKLAAPVPRQAYVVAEDYRLLGIVSALDLLKVIIPPYLNADLARSVTDEYDFLQKQVEKVKDKTAAEIMVSDFAFVYAHHQLMEADVLITERGINTLPVIDMAGKLLGEISRRDILLQLAGDYCSALDIEGELMVDLATVSPP